MRLVNFCEAMSKTLQTARKGIWRFFRTVCFILLVFFLTSPADTIAATMAEFNCIGLIAAGVIVETILCVSEFFDKKSRSMAWLDIIGYLVGIACSSAILWLNESSLQQIGT